ncbi:polyphosphate kinase 1 [Planctomyces sp. SH-PL14]|uniref:polyphosphate kinase 1 n=1 Tax=Planctomyces sp. SH-PL14 TaxID=1632864 RepID=UPI00078DFB91|nr:polyphosphate kinase 1 [Planctomyces sp. SH-PL14]AMV16869.1 Polyphosphate kinase [Planctomyces sp. SH-PL14]
MSRLKTNYLNRELSWLDFNQRVLEEAADTSIPLLERLKFLAISASNLDEFFRVRVGGLQTLEQQGVMRPDAAGLTPEQQLTAIRRRVRQMIEEQYRVYREELEPQLAASGMRCLRPSELNAAQKRVLKQVFQNEIYPVLTPMAVGGEIEFPLLSSQGLNVCVRLAPGEGAEADAFRYAIIPLAGALSRIIGLPADAGYSYLLLEDAVTLYVGDFFPGETILETIPFRITRNADMSVREDSAEDLMEEMSNILDARRLGNYVRLEILENASAELTHFLRHALDIVPESLYPSKGPLDLSAFFRISDRPGFDHLKYESWPPFPSPDLPPGSSVFEAVSLQDILLYHPYESFEPVVRFIEQAADDPDVLAIKQTLYRTSRDSPIVAALLRAAERGKNVTVICELKARFDEARNIEWARQLEQAGAQVIYGVKGLKTHAKVCVVIRREPQGIQRYVHFGTGNYNEQTSRIYSDVSLLTCHPDLGADAIAFFNAVTGYSQPLQYHRIAAAPLGLRDKLLEMIRAETEIRRDGRPARIWAKLNALVDPTLIDALYDASQAGVEIKLNVRGVCCLRPGVKDLSENIEVVSIVDRFLEHARVLHFHHGGDDRVFISSADWMPRNLDRRVELLVPVEDPRCRDRLIHILEVCFADTVKSRKLTSSGTHRRIKVSGAEAIRSQQRLYDEANEARHLADQQRRTIFEPHRPG